MPVLTITGVVFGTDIIEIIGHGQVTGNGPAAVRNIGDGALPTPLVPVTDVWLIRVDNDHVKLATSSANALAGTAINLSDNGSGTNLVEIGIPYERARTYVPKAVDVAGSQVKSADLNAVMDALKAMHRLLTSQAQSTWSIEDTLVVPGRMATEVYGVSPAHIPVNQGTLLSASAQTLSYPIPLAVGRKIKGWKLYVRKTTAGTDTISAQLYKFDSTTGVQTALGTLQPNNANAPGFISLSELGLAETITAGVQYYVKFNPGGATAANHIAMHLEVYSKFGA